MTGEDGVSDTVAPRVLAAGGATDSVSVLTGRNDRPYVIPDDLEEIEDHIVRTGSVLLIIDPLASHLSASINSHKDQDVRRALTPLSRMAERTGVAVALVRHLNKSEKLSAMYRGGGSIGITGAARTVFLVGIDPLDPARRALVCVKNNLAPPPEGLLFELHPDLDRGVAKVQFAKEPCLYSAEDLLTVEDDRGNKRQKAADFLKEKLQKAPRAAIFLKQEGGQNGFSPKTLERAKKDLGIGSEKKGGVWYWTLPGQGGH
jgi:hypothetical protein